MPKNILKIPGSRLPTLSSDQMREVDRMMLEDLGIDLLQMMELAGYSLATLTQSLLGEKVHHGPILVLSGGGNNGGGGMTAARHLRNRGAAVSVIFVGDTLRMKPAPLHQMRSLQAMGIDVEHWNGKGPDILKQRISTATGIIDALVGYGLIQPPRGAIGRAIHAINSAGIPVFSLDVPSGFETTQGIILDPCVRATATLALALPKSGLLSRQGRQVAGRVFVTDIGVPGLIYNRMGFIFKSPFMKETLIEVVDHKDP